MNTRENSKKKKKKLKRHRFIVANVLFKNICDEAEITKNPKNPL